MKENLELVTRFEDLKVGMLVILTACRWCGNTHRMMLLKLNNTVIEPDGTSLQRPVWRTTQPSHRNKPGESIGVTRNSVEQRRLYRIVDPLLDGASNTKKLERI